MFKQVIFWFFSLVGFSAQATNMINLSQSAILKDKNTSYVLVDVRTPKEFSEGHVPNAINIPLSEIAESLGQLHAIEDKELVIYCRSGFRAEKASSILQKNGFSDIHHLEGDMLGWVKSGLTIEK